MRRRLVRRWGWIGLAIWLAGLAAWTLPVHAADLPFYDLNVHRQRLLNSTDTGSTSQLCSDIPIYLEMGSPGLMSQSTPNIVGSAVYQYLYSSTASSTDGWVYQATLPTATTAQSDIQTAEQTGAQAVVISPTNAGASTPAITISTGSTQQPVGQDSLSTGSYTGGQPSGT